VLGSSKIYSRQQDVVDVLAVISAFEEIHKCTILMKMYTQRTRKAKVLQIEFKAVRLEEGTGEALRLGSHQSSWGFFQPIGLESVILQGLYKLDAVIDATIPVPDENK
jgi:hypothetical protein